MTELPITWISTIFVCNFTNWGTRLSRQLCSYFCVCIRCLTEHFLNFNIRFQLSNYNCWTMFVLSLNYVCLVAELCLSCRWTMFVLSLNYVCLVSELCLSCRTSELCLSCRKLFIWLSNSYFQFNLTHTFTITPQFEFWVTVDLGERRLFSKLLFSVGYRIYIHIL